MSVRMMAGLIRGFEASQDRYTKLRAARDANRQRQEALDLKKGALDLKKKEFEAKGQMNPGVEAMLKMQHDRLKGEKSVLDWGNSEIDKESSSLQQQQQAMKKKIAVEGMIADLEASGELGVSFDEGGNRKFTLKNPTRGKTTKEPDLTRMEQVDAMIESGGYEKEGEFRPVKDKKMMKNIITSQHGTGWLKNKEMVEKFEDKYKEKEVIELPKEIKTYPQAVKYLVENQGMSKEEANQWIKDND